MSEPFVIESHKGPYKVRFQLGVEASDLTLASLTGGDANSRAHYIVDARLEDLYQKELSDVIGGDSILTIKATEGAKSLDKFSRYVEQLVAAGVRRGDCLIAIGGGITQDITCFLAATMLRGLDWHFVPTTLLAQADSCIGSKSSINVGSAKNILGTFTPPKTVLIAASFLETLDERDVRSGIGEMLKVHAIEGSEAYDQIAGDYGKLLEDREVLLHYINRSLLIKKKMIEKDEFDKGPRQVMNYGHTFGHAIEAATNFGIPHGIAVTIGMDMANYFSAAIGRSTNEEFVRMHPVLRKNYRGYEDTPVPEESFFSAILKDKKNTKNGVGMILPDADGKVEKVLHAPDEDFKSVCRKYLAEVRLS